MLIRNSFAKEVKLNCMYTKQNKKLLIMNILDILKRYTDEDHIHSQKEIVDILKNE